MEDTAKHESSTTNLGNGPLEKIDLTKVDPDVVDSIGEFCLTGNSDTEEPDDSYEEDIPIDLEETKTHWGLTLFRKYYKHFGLLRKFGCLSP